MPKGILDQAYNLAAPVYFKSSPRRVPFANDATISYGMLLPDEQFGQHSKSRPAAEMTAAHSGSSSGNGHVSNSTMIKSEVPGNSSCTEVKNVPYNPHCSSDVVMPPAPLAPPTVAQTQGQLTSPVFQGLLDPKAQYHKSLAEHSRMERVQRKQQEEANKQQQVYIQLLQQYRNQLPESTRPQAEMLQTLLTDPNMVTMLQHIFKGQQQQEQSATPTDITTPSPTERTPPLSAPPSISPGPLTSSSAINQSMFQYQPNSSKEYSQVTPDAFAIEVSKRSSFNGC